MSAEPGRSRRADLVVGLLLVLLAFALLVSLIGSSSGTARSHHGLYHSASIYQIRQGLVPPTNPLSMGQPAISYWAWYLVVAAVMGLLDLTSFQVAALSNGLALALLWLGIWLGARRWAPSAWTRLALACAPFLVLVPHRWGVAWGGFGTPRIDLFAKFLNFNSFPLAVGLLAVLLPVVLWAPVRARWRAAAGGVLAAALSFLHPTSSIAVVALAGVGIGGTLPAVLLRRLPRAELAPFLGVLAGFCVAFPYMNDLRQALGQQTGLVIRPAELWSNLRTAGLSLALPSALVAWGALRWRTLDAPARLLVLLGLALAAGSVAIEIPGNNQYKLNLLLAVPSAFLLGVLVPRAARGVGAFALALVLAVAAGVDTWRGYGEYPWFGQDLFRYDGTTVDLAVPPGDRVTGARQEAYAWLRDHTAPESFVLTRPLNMNEMLLPVIAQRRAVCATGRRDLHLGFPHQEELIELSTRLVEDLERGRDPHRSLGRLRALPLAWPERLHVIAENGPGLDEAGWTERLGALGWRTSFANDGFVVLEAPMAAAAPD